MEDRNRVSGIRINCATGQAAPAENTAPKVTGVARLIGGERVIDQATVAPGGSGSVLPFAMNCRAVRTGLNPQGLFVKLCGRAAVSPPTATSFTLDDGSPIGMLVELHGVQPPANGDYVAVTGVLGANSGDPVLRVGLSDTIRKLN
jgi:hypothetical protein